MTPDNTMTPAERCKRFIGFIQSAFGTAVPANDICCELATQHGCSEADSLSVIDSLLKTGEIKQHKEGGTAYYVPAHPAMDIQRPAAA